MSSQAALPIYSSIPLNDSVEEFAWDATSAKTRRDKENMHLQNLLAGPSLGGHLAPVSRPVRIVVTHYDIPVDVSGVSTWMHALVPGFQKSGLDVRVHIINNHDRPGANIKHFQEMGVPVRWCQPLHTMREKVRQCVKWINEDTPDIYILSSLLPAYYAARHACQHGMQTVGVLHNDDAFSAAIIEEFIATDPRSRLSAVVAVSEHLQKRVVAAGARDLPCYRIPCGVDIPDKRADYDAGRFKIAYLGRLVDEQKQISLVTEALCEAARRQPGLEAFIVGDGPERAKVENIIARHPHRDRVHLTGRLDNKDVVALLENMQAFVLLSDYEGLPVSLLEAMAGGVVPICLRTRSGVQEVIRSGDNGLLVEDRGEAFQSAVARLIAEPATWMRCSAAARETVKSKFSREFCHRAWISVLEETRKGACDVKYPIPLPSRAPRPHPGFDWKDPSLPERLRMSIGRMRRRIRQHWR